MIEKVLEITKIPTSSAITPKTWMSVREEREALLHVGRQLGGRLLAGDRLDVVGQRVAGCASASSSWLMPSSAAGDAPVWICAVGAGEALGLGERELGRDGAGRALGGAEEHGADERRTPCCPNWVTTVTVSPTAKSPSSAAATLRAISSSAVGPAALGDRVGRERAAVDPALEERRRALRRPIGSPSASSTRLVLPKPKVSTDGSAAAHAVDGGDRVDGVGGEQRALVAAAEAGR